MRLVSDYLTNKWQVSLIFLTKPKTSTVLFGLEKERNIATLYNNTQKISHSNVKKIFTKLSPSMTTPRNSELDRELPSTLMGASGDG